MFNTPNTEKSPRALPLVGMLLHKLENFFWQNIPIFSWDQNGLLQTLQKSSHIIIIWCITAARLRILIIQSRFESAVFPRTKFKITDEAIFQNAIFPKAIFL